MNYKGSAPDEDEDATPPPVAKPAAAPKPAPDTSMVSSILAKIKAKKAVAAAIPKPKKIDKSLINSGAEIVIE